ncbi:class I SAM-dependent methyltransferase [Aestuariimicrobium sp. T2.26MG-19.2B]|uniref:class I SAM-dependent methyltransferase n=1 Tax=Aestuariimicrobium sp. T2.26MG-19.2B TaxID=3040679 RepID=UPI002477905B|nr:methyltransferase [Aestuariimicrobium sp. T2.26MG-19.2B]CAI9406864.1 Ribosomal RNA small subunit methyltransferase C [Aestuariimicrobium sp. T2.26MG-19.2B]
MSHYFDSPAEPLDLNLVRTVDCQIWDETLTFRTAAGVFSGTRLDPGTSVLLKESAPPTGALRVADVGCGFGPIAVALARVAPAALVDAVDVNDRALQLTRLNADALGVGERVRALRPDEVDPMTRYDQIWSNPPIRIGKPALHELLLTWLPRLAPAGEARLVVGKNLGADSLQRWIGEQWVDGVGFACERAASAKGFRVLSVHLLP